MKLQLPWHRRSHSQFNSGDPVGGGCPLHMFRGRVDISSDSVATVIIAPSEGETLTAIDSET